MFIALLLVARYVELVARRRAGDAVEAVAKARPATAERLVAWPQRREVETVGAAALAEGDFVLVRAGATMPADGVVVEGRASVEEAILTGESRPRAQGARRRGACRQRGPRRRAGRARQRRRRGDAARRDRAPRHARGGRASACRSHRRPRRRVVRRRAARAGGGHGDRLVAARSCARAGGDLRGAGRVVPVRAVARHAGGAGGGGGRARADAGRRRPCRRAGDARARHARRLRQDRHAHPRPSRARRGAGPARRGARGRPRHSPLRSRRRRSTRWRWPSGRRRRVSRCRRSSSCTWCPVTGSKAWSTAGSCGSVVRNSEAALSGQPLPAAAVRLDPAATLVALGDGQGHVALFALGDALRPGAHALIAQLRAPGHRADDPVRRRAPAVAATAARARHRRCARRGAARGQARRDRRAAGRRRGRRDGRRRHQRRAVAGAGAGVDQPRQRDAAGAVDRRRRRARRRTAADRRRDSARAAHVPHRAPEPRLGVRLQRDRHSRGGLRLRDAARGGGRHVGVVAAGRRQRAAPGAIAPPAGKRAGTPGAAGDSVQDAERA